MKHVTNSTVFFLIEQIYDQTHGNCGFPVAICDNVRKALELGRRPSIREEGVKMITISRFLGNRIDSHWHGIWSRVKEGNRWREDWLDDKFRKQYEAETATDQEKQTQTPL